MVRFGRTRAFWESQAGCHFSTNAQRVCTLPTSFYSIFYVPSLSCIWSQSVLIVSLLLCFHCDTETSSRDVDLTLCSHYHGLFRFLLPLWGGSFRGSFVKLLRMTTFAVSYFFIFFFYFLIVAFLIHYRKTRKPLYRGSSSFCETDIRNGGACCLHTGGCNGRVHCQVAGFLWQLQWVFFAGKSFVKRNIHLLMWLRTLALSNSAMNFFIYSA